MPVVSVVTDGSRFTGTVRALVGGSLLLLRSPFGGGGGRASSLISVLICTLPLPVVAARALVGGSLLLLR